MLLATKRPGLRATYKVATGVAALGDAYARTAGGAGAPDMTWHSSLAVGERAADTSFSDIRRPPWTVGETADIRKGGRVVATAESDITRGVSARKDLSRRTTLRARWHRAFAVLTVVVVLSGAASFIGIRLMVDTYRSSAVGLEREASASATLRGEMVATAIGVASAATPSQQNQLVAAETAIREDFIKDGYNIHNAAAKGILAQSLASWSALVSAAGSPGHPADVTARGAAITTHISAVLALLDQADAANRASVRHDLARAAALDREALAGIALVELMAVGLVLLLARRLSSEVLRPVAMLRDSASLLGRGVFDHRVVVDRTDELGELAVSFNAMADAIAGIQRELVEEASTDSLTGLANRTAFYARLVHTLARPNRRATEQALLFIDLDDFKNVNDTFGHAVGDELLIEVARRLRDVMRPADLVARLGGDEFAMWIDGLPDAAAALVLAERVVTTLAMPFSVASHDLWVGASVGLAMRDDDSVVDGWLHEADVAMYCAKERGKNRVERYDADLHEAALSRLSLQDTIGTAAERGELVLEYQPVADLATGALVGLEALVRWQHPIQGLLPPSAFIDLAEQNGAILSVGSWVMETAARSLSSWQRRYGRPDLWMSVNVSVCQLETPTCADIIHDILLATEVDPKSMMIEVTESVLADPNGNAAATLTTLRRAGVRVALDDFGTGYSSISYLRQLPVDLLKIDRSFVTGASPGAPGTALLEAIIAMAERLDLDIIAEGIEEPSELSQLKVLGCEKGQGFLMSRPVAASAIESLLATPLPFLEFVVGELVVGELVVGELAVGDLVELTVA
jgi:diguanylate cyclase (GGDEF)-like protein